MLNLTTLRIKSSYKPNPRNTRYQHQMDKLTIQQMTERLKREMERKEKMTPYKERPILFSAPMVRAILEDRKTQTRRMVKSPWKNKPIVYLPDADEALKEWYGARADRNDPSCWGIENVIDIDPLFLNEMDCPYGMPGDQFWVRENFNVIVHSSDMDEDRVSVTYRADNKPALVQLDTDIQWEQAERLKKRDTVPSIHMPRWASRIDLLIKDVRVERLQDISEDDAKSEGLIFTDYGKRCLHGDGADKDIGNCPATKGHEQRAGWSFDVTTSPDQCFHNPINAFGNLWQSIKGNESWYANPWVWAIDFERIKP